MEVPAWHVLLVQCATFLVGMLLLRVIALKPIQRILADRRERIIEAQQLAAATQERSEGLERELKIKLARVDGDAKRQSRMAEAAARKSRDEILNGARQEARDIVAQGREDARRDRAETSIRLHKDAVRMSVAIARKVTAMALTPKDRKRLIAKALTQIETGLKGDA